MKTIAFAPGHISGFFEPVYNANKAKTGSRGAGINVNLGAKSDVSNKPLGIITESDIIKKVVAENLKASEVNVEDIMSSPIIVIDPYVPLEEAMKTMGKCNIRRLPVVEKGKLIGIITNKDISKISPVLHEISREWYDISKRDELYIRRQVFSGKCEDCGTLSTNLLMSYRFKQICSSNNPNNLFVFHQW